MSNRTMHIQAAATSRSTGILLVLAIALVAALAVVTLEDSPLKALAVPAALAVAVGVVAYPFVGLVAVTFGSQTGGLIERVSPLAGEWALEGLAALVILGVVATSYAVPRERRFGAPTLALKLALMFLVVVLLSALFADDTDLARDGLRKRVNLLLLFWLVVHLTHTSARVRVLVSALILSTVLSAGLAVLGYTTGIQAVPPEDPTEFGEAGPLRQVGAASQNATTSARMMLAGTALAAVIALRSRRRRLAYVAAAVIGFAGTVVTFSRSTNVVMAAGALWLLLKTRRHKRFPLIVVVALVLALLVLSVVPGYFWDRLSKVGQKGADFTIGRRLGYHLIGLDLVASHPLLGVGPENYRKHYMGYEYRYMPGRYLQPRELHNMYFSVTVETGLLGIACFVALLGAALVGLNRARRTPDEEFSVIAEALQFSFALFLAACVFGAAETNKFLWILLGLSVAAGELVREAGPGRSLGPTR